MEKHDLKIELRAYPVATDRGTLVHRLDYRISPNQDLSHYVNVSWFGGRIKFRFKWWYSTKWKAARYFRGTFSNHGFDESINWEFIELDKESELDRYKQFSTYGDFKFFLDSMGTHYYNDWLPKRNEYLSQHKIWY